MCVHFFTLRPSYKDNYLVPFKRHYLLVFVEGENRSIFDSWLCCCNLPVQLYICFRSYDAVMKAMIYV